MACYRQTCLPTEVSFELSRGIQIYRLRRQPDCRIPPPTTPNHLPLPRIATLAREIIPTRTSPNAPHPGQA